MHTISSSQGNMGSSVRVAAFALPWVRELKVPGHISQLLSVLAVKRRKRRAPNLRALSKWGRSSERGCFLLLIGFLTSSVCGQDSGKVQSNAGGPAEVTIDASQTREPISPYIYGQFIEHLGRCIY